MKAKEVVSVFVFFAVLVFLVVWTFQVIMHPYNLISEMGDLNCAKTGNLLMDSGCLNKEMQKIYKFNLTNFDKKLTEEELKKYGGTCLHFSLWYFFNLRRMGYEAKLVTLERDKNYAGHVFTIGWNEDRSVYCVLDQTEYSCFVLKSLKIEEVLNRR